MALAMKVIAAIGAFPLLGAGCPMMLFEESAVVRLTDLERAQRKKPRPEYKGAGPAAVADALNGHLRQTHGLRTLSCDNFHLKSFAADEDLDTDPLPASQGGSAYLGRVRIDPLDDGSGRRVTADHYMKWAFHFLVDADEQSPSYGLPLRLYGPYGVRQVFSDWKMDRPSEVRPGFWDIPEHCEIKSKACDVFSSRTQRTLRA